MPPELLGISTILPGQGRTLKQYTIQDAKKELKTITELQNDKSAFIKGIKIRKEDIDLSRSSGKIVAEEGQER